MLLILVNLVIVALAAPWWNVPRDQADSAGMLAHLHAYLVDGDLLYDDEYAALGMSPLFAFVTDEGVVSNHWPMGATWLQAPGYALGLGASRALAWMGLGRGDPLGVVVVLAVRAWALMVLAWIAWGAARLCAETIGRAARSQRGAEATGRASSAEAHGGAGASDAAGAWPDARDPAWRAGWAIAIGMVIGTPLLYYAAEAPLRPHVWGAAVCLAIVGVWQRPVGSHGRARTLALASLVGLATCVRPQLGVLWLLVVHDAWGDRRRWSRIGLGLVAFVPWPLLLLRSQLWMYGGDVLGYLGAGGGAGTDGGVVTHHLRAFLLSTHHGVLPWCPVLLLAIAAMGRSAVLRERGAWLLLALVLWQVWIDSGMRAIEPRTVLGTRTWSGGVSFGPRKLVDVLPLMLPAIASLTAAVQRRGRRETAVLAGVAALACTPTLLLHVSAWLDPGATTGGIMDGAVYTAALVRPFDSGAWSTALAQRALPIGVALTIAGLLALAMIGAIVPLGRALRAWLHADPEPARRMGLLALGALLGLHGWLAVLLLRSDAALEADPTRMPAAAARMTPAHLGTVRQIPRHHALLRARLGDHAAPP